MKEFFNHDKHTKLNTVVLLQRNIIREQLDKLQTFSTNQVDSSLSEKCISSYLVQRAETQKKIIDDFELALLIFLDSDGKISSLVRLQDFMFLMTRITKVCKYMHIVLLLLHSMLTTLYNMIVLYLICTLCIDGPEDHVSVYNS